MLKSFELVPSERNLMLIFWQLRTINKQGDIALAAIEGSIVLCTHKINWEVEEEIVK